MTVPTHGVIWISGFSASGKTTIGRKVEADLKNQGLNTIFLDGDDLRSIFAAKWGYERQDRVELAHVYFRMASHLAAQGFTVIISAVAMYDEVRKWVRTNVPGSVQVYLNVPEDERLRRDSETKGLYRNITGSSPDYDEPDEETLCIDNFGGDVTPETVAEAIVEHYRSQRPATTDYGRTDHWGDYYARRGAPQKPSPFAIHVAQKLEGETHLLEVGCGNGRDSLYFASIGHRVTGIDMSQAAIESCKSQGGSATFLAGTISQLGDQLDDRFDAVYSRFVIHAMPLVEEEQLLDDIARRLKPGGRLFIECRSINDPMARMGEVISPTERIHGHYRRFIIPDELRDRISSRGFAIRHKAESKGLAVHGDDDPMVIRIEAERLS